MIQANSYQDIQVLQDAEFSNSITFDSEYDTNDYSYQAKIAADRKNTPFTYNGVEDAVNDISFTITITSPTVLTLSLNANQTSKFEDDFEGVWDLLSKRTSNSTFTREIAGDVVVSPSVTPKF